MDGAKGWDLCNAVTTFCHLWFHQNVGSAAADSVIAARQIVHD
jgi:hypothetical protein